MEFHVLQAGLKLVSQIELVFLSLCMLTFQVTEKSGAQVRVMSDSGDHECKTTVCFLLQGSKEQVLLARCVLENLLTECELVSEILEVPQSSFGRIIGRLKL